MTMAANTLEKLRDLTARYGSDSDFPVAALPSLYMSRFERSVPALHHIAEPTVSLILQGSKQIVLESKVLEYKAGDILVNSVDLPITVHMSKSTPKNPLLAVGVRLNPTIINDLVVASNVTFPKIFAGSIGVAKAPEAFLKSLLRLVELLQAPEDRAVLIDGIERELHWRLLQSDLGGIVSQLGPRGSHTDNIVRTIRWIRANYEKPLKIKHLSKIAVMSPTSYHRHFRAITLMSPLQYQKKIRLQEARLRLKSSRENVSSIGLDVGYESPSQFSREYRREFGVSPAEDAKEN